MIPNSDGVFFVATRAQVVRLKKQQYIGKLTGCNGAIAEVSGTEANTEQLDWKTVVIGEIPSKEKNQILHEDICNALYYQWVLVHGLPNFLPSDQGSNVDGNVIREICNKFSVVKRRASAYHSQGNGFSERSFTRE